MYLYRKLTLKVFSKAYSSKNGGTGYSGQIKAYVEGANSENFDLGEVSTNEDPLQMLQ